MRAEPVVYVARPRLVGNDLGHDIETLSREAAIDRIRAALVGEWASADAGYVHTVDAVHAPGLAEVAYDALVGGGS